MKYSKACLVAFSLHKMKRNRFEAMLKRPGVEIQSQTEPTVERVGQTLTTVNVAVGAIFHQRNKEGHMVQFAQQIMEF